MRFEDKRTDKEGERNLVEGIGKGTRLDSRDGDLDFESERERTWTLNTERERDRERPGGWGVGGQGVDDERSFRQVSRSGVEDLGQVRGVGLARGG